MSLKSDLAWRDRCVCGETPTPRRCRCGYEACCEWDFDAHVEARFNNDLEEIHDAR